MGEVSVEYLKPGMKLAGDLKNAMGRMLLKQGTIIEPKHIRIMNMWGITAADVEGVDQENITREEMKQFDPELLKQLHPHVETVFRPIGDSEEHESMRELKRLWVFKKAQKITRGDSDLPEPGEETEAEKDDGLQPETVIPAAELVDGSIKLASLPDIYHRIMEVLNDTRSSATHLAQVVSNDPALSATLLKVVNSAFYSLPSKVSSITRAIALIGGKELSTIAMGISVIRHFKDVPPDVIDMKKFWMHSIAVGVLARLLANYKIGFPEEEFFITGLLHDIGRLVLLKECPQITRIAIRDSRRRHVPLFQVENEMLGYNHSTLAGLLMAKWNFPQGMRKIVKFHHTPLGSPKIVETAIIYMANIMATAFNFGSSGESCVPYFPAKIWDSLELSVSVLKPILNQAERQIHEILDAFSLDTNTGDK